MIPLGVGKPPHELRLSFVGTSLRAMTSFFDFEMDDINGDRVALSKFRDQVSLVVNVASK